MWLSSSLSCYMYKSIENETPWLSGLFRCSKHSLLLLASAYRKAKCSDYIHPFVNMMKMRRTSDKPVQYIRWIHLDGSNCGSVMLHPTHCIHTKSTFFTTPMLVRNDNLLSRMRGGGLSPAPNGWQTISSLVLGLT